MDRNQIIGFSLLALLLIGFFTYNNINKAKYEKYNQHVQDSIQRQQRSRDSIAGRNQQPTVPTTVDSQRLQLAQDSLNQTLPAGLQKRPGSIVKLENKDLALEISTAGAMPVSALLKDYRTYDSTPLYFFQGGENQLSLGLPNVQGAATTADLNFVPQPQTSPASLTLSADLGGGRRVDMTYLLPAEGYMLQCAVKYTGMAAGSVPLRWTTLARHTERDVANERTTAQIYYQYKNEDHDYYTIRDDNESKSLSEGPAHWVGFRMHYFSSALISDDNGFSDVKVNSTVKLDSNTVAKNDTRGTVALKGDGTANLRWYIGPNHYQTLRKYKIGLDEMVPLGFGFFAFVKYINKGLIIPVFNVLNSTGLNMGIIIMILTVFIRLILSFFTYKSYLSSAKMRVLKPEIDALRAKYGSDQQQFGMEQMKLYRSAGVSPLGGCLPTLFQIPILFAMYYFFPSSIELRQESFLWAHDLSTYDSIASWTTNVPVLSSVYGNHISLFTLLMTASSLFLALYNRNMTAGAQPDNPVMKYMPFVFPIILMGVFNKMAAALTFYYFFSNCISILQQFIIQKFVIDEKKIHAQMQEARNKPATPSKWQAKLEEMQKLQAERAKKK